LYIKIKLGLIFDKDKIDQF